jgi:hypothetical protein
MRILVASFYWPNQRYLTCQKYLLQSRDVNFRPFFSSITQLLEHTTEYNWSYTQRPWCSYPSSRRPQILSHPMLGSSQFDLHISIFRKLPGFPLKVPLRTLAAGQQLHMLLFPTKCYPKTRCRNETERECLRVRVQAAVLRSD